MKRFKIILKSTFLNNILQYNYTDNSYRVGWENIKPFNINQKQTGSMSALDRSGTIDQ